MESSSELTNEEAPVIPTEDPAIPAWQTALYESRQRELQAREEANQLREAASRRVEPAPTAEPPLEAGDTFNQPEKFRQTILRDVQATVAPINKYIAAQERREAYNRLKNSIKAGANAEGLANFTRIEHLVDAAFDNNPSLTIDANTFQTVLQNVVGGLYLSGAMSSPAPASPSNPAAPVQPPPTIRSAPATPRPTSNVDVNSLTENERRLARDSRMSPEEYVIMRDTSPDKAEETWKGILKKRSEAKK